MFILALIYNVVHATALFYQVIALNVAVNSFNNALLTLLISNQFVEVKSTVFKKIEKDNLFQLTCADIVERFQLWLMLVIIALRNIVEVGYGDPTGQDTVFPSSFIVLPSWSGEVLAPFLLVLGSEMLVDWIKHSYISKFNNVKPAVYQRYLDVLAKDYYTNVSYQIQFWRPRSQFLGIRQSKLDQAAGTTSYSTVMPLHQIFNADISDVSCHTSSITCCINGDSTLGRVSYHIACDNCRSRAF